MRGRTVGLLAGLGVLALAGGWYFGAATTPAEQTSVATGQLMFPGLAGRLKDAARVVITHQGKATVIEKRADGAWGIAAMHDYPVQETKLRGMLTGLTELRLAEARTTVLPLPRTSHAIPKRGEKSSLLGLYREESGSPGPTC